MRDMIRKPTGAMIDHARLTEITERMRSWSELSDDIKETLPTAICAAIMSGRPELVQFEVAAAKRPLYKSLLRVIEVLLETNIALQVHAEEVAKRTRILEDSLKGVVTAARRIDNFANFRTDWEGDDL